MLFVPSGAAESLYQVHWQNLPDEVFGNSGACNSQERNWKVKRDEKSIHFSSYSTNSSHPPPLPHARSFITAMRNVNYCKSQVGYYSTSSNCKEDSDAGNQTRELTNTQDTGKKGGAKSLFTDNYL
ncbi:hypothetical protein STEG23_027101 [Scotinomys teguina]